jgi:hypothetical protein
MSVEAWWPVEAAWIWWLVRSGVIVVALLLFAWALTRHGRDAALRHQALQLQHESVRAQLNDLTERTAALGAALAALSGRIESPQPALPAARPTPQRSGYEIAIRLARGGASIDELMASSGATRSEAELLRRLHGGAAEAQCDTNHKPRAARG